MKLFISWSGEFSKRVAECLSKWIPTIIQSVDPFYSPNDIAKGEHWSSRLSEELEQSNYGIICLTPENVMAPWIHFEAGALSKAANSRVSAIMLNITPSQIKGPLARFQNTAVDQDDFYRLFKSINSFTATPLKPEILENAFKNSWKNLSAELETIISDYSSCPKVPDPENRSDSEAVQEILRLVRNISNVQETAILLYYSMHKPEYSPMSSLFAANSDPLSNTFQKNHLTYRLKSKPPKKNLICPDAEIGQE